MRFLRDLLHVGSRSAVLHPTAILEVSSAPEETFERVVRAIGDLLGGTVRSAEPAAGRIEATFGLIDSERLTCTIEPSTHGTRVTIESRSGPRMQPRTASLYVDALANALRQNAGDQ